MSTENEDELPTIGFFTCDGCGTTFNEDSIEAKIGMHRYEVPVFNKNNHIAGSYMKVCGKVEETGRICRIIKFRLPDAKP